MGLPSNTRNFMDSNFIISQLNSLLPPSDPQSSSTSFSSLLTRSMEPPSTIRLATSLFFFSVLLIFTATVINPVVGLENCKFPAVFNFGDSNSDTGGYAAAFSQPSWPYGRTFFGMPANRFSDGRLVIDFIGMHDPLFSLFSAYRPTVLMAVITVGPRAIVIKLV